MGIFSIVYPKPCSIYLRGTISFYVHIYYHMSEASYADKSAHDLAEMLLQAPLCIVRLKCGVGFDTKGLVGVFPKAVQGLGFPDMAHKVRSSLLRGPSNGDRGLLTHRNPRTVIPEPYTPSLVPPSL